MLGEQRRAIRYKLDVPLRIILHKIDATLIRQGRGAELNECGLCVLVGVELTVGDDVKIDFLFLVQENRFESRGWCRIATGIAMDASSFQATTTNGTR